MAEGLRVWDASGNLVFDSVTALGGVIVDAREQAAGASATLTFPAFAGRSVVLVPLAVGGGGATEDFGATADTALGYPRVNIAARSFSRRLFSIVE